MLEPLECMIHIFARVAGKDSTGLAGLGHKVGKIDSVEAEVEDRLVGRKAETVVGLEGRMAEAGFEDRLVGAALEDILVEARVEVGTEMGVEMAVGVELEETWVVH